jgi:hypothetical protein
MVEIAQVTNDKFNIVQTLLGRINTGFSDRFHGYVHPGKPAIRKQIGQPVQYSPPAATDIQNTDAFGEPASKTRHEGKHVGLKRRQHRLPAVESDGFKCKKLVPVIYQKL